MWDSACNVAMASRSEIASRLAALGLVAVVRVPKREQVLPVCEALVAGGVLALEVTLTVPEALAAIREVSKQLGDRALVGAGTVLNVDQARAVLEAGAEYLVSPIMRPELIAVAHTAQKPVMIGAYTPTEAQVAHEAGADFIKIFPADKLGAGYIKNLRGPLPHLRMVPTGGIDLQTIPEFVQAGCAALGVGSSLLQSEILKTQNWPELTRLAREFVRVLKEARSGLP